MLNNKRRIFKSILLTFVIVLMSMITIIPSLATTDSGVMKNYKSSSKNDYYNYRNEIVTITFLDLIDNDALNSSNTIESWDVSAAGDNSVIAWMKLNEEATTAADANRYDVYIAANGKIKANPNSSHLFFNFYNLESIIGLENFDTSNVTNMSYMFYNCSNLKSLNLNSFNTNNVTNMTAMFYNCVALENLYVSNFKVNNVTTTISMFAGCSSLTSLDISNFNMNSNTNMSFMFAGCESLANLKMENTNMNNVVYMTGLFQYCSSLESVKLKNISKVTDMSLLFSECTNLKSVIFENVNSNKLENTSYMFEKCSNLVSIEFNNFNTENVTDMTRMFADCENLVQLDLSSFNTLRVKSMADMFYHCFNLKTLNLSNFNTENVQSMNGMFANCSSLENLNVNHFNTSNVLDMSLMFHGCSSLKVLNISNFITKNVHYMSSMFAWCSNLETIYIGDHWNTEHVIQSDNMFNNCYKLKGNISYAEDCLNHYFANKHNYMTYKIPDFKYAISTSYNENNVYVNAYVHISAYTTPENKNISFNYVSANPNIATVDKTGQVHGISVGTTTITVSAKDGNSRTVTINVLPDPGTTTLTFFKTESVDSFSISTDGGYIYRFVYSGDVINVYKNTDIYIKIEDPYDKYLYSVNGNVFQDNNKITLTIDEPTTIGVVGAKANEEFSEIVPYEPFVEKASNGIIGFFERIIDKIIAFFEKLFGIA